MSLLRAFSSTSTRARLARALAVAAWLVPAAMPAFDPPVALAAPGGVIAPGENLVVDGIPPVPAAIAEAARRYTESRSAAFQSWHPSRREVLITTRFGDTTQVHRVAAPGAARRQLTFFPDRVRAASFPPAGAGDFFVFAKDEGGSEWTQLYRYDVADGEVTLLTDGRSQNVLGAWSHSGRWLAYGSTRRNGADRDLYVIDPRDPKSDRRVAEMEGGGFEVLDWSPDEHTLLVQEEISANESYLWRIDVERGTKTALTTRLGPVVQRPGEPSPTVSGQPVVRLGGPPPPGLGEQVFYGEARFSADGKGFYAITDRDSEFQRLAYIDAQTLAPLYLTTHIPWDVEAFEPSHDGRTLAFVTNEEGLSVLHLLDTATHREAPVPGLPAGVIRGLGWSADDREIAFDLQGARSPSDVYSLNVATLESERWTESETGGVDTSAWPEAELVRWRSFDERTISGFLYRPPARFTGPRPVVIDIHGGPEGQAQPVFLGRKGYFLSELGAALIFPNVRGSSGYGKSFLKLDNGRLREDSVKDIGALLDWIKTRPDLDPERVMITGGSYGGYMTLAAATHYSDRIRCALSVVGISNFVTFLERTQAYRRDLRRVEYGDERDPHMRALLESIAPVRNADKIGKPLFVVQGRNDPRVPYTEAEQMVATLEKKGAPVWLLMAKDEGHGFSRKPNQDFLFYATVLFMQEYLLK